MHGFRLLCRGIMWTGTRLAVQPASDGHHNPESQPSRLLGKPEVPLASLRRLKQAPDQIVPCRVKLIVPSHRNIELRQQFDLPTLADGRIDPEHQIAQV